VKTIDDVEDEATKVLVPKLQLALEVAHCGNQLCQATVAQIPDQDSVRSMPISLRVCATLLMRIADDIRCAVILATKGYPVQAASLGASTFEHAFNVGYIGANDARGAEWCDHENPYRMPVKKAERLVECAIVATLGLGDDVQPKTLAPDVAVELEKKVRAQMEVYMQFCLPKHGNPLVQKQHNWTRDGDTIELYCGPSLAEVSLQNSLWALDQVGRLAALACEAFEHYHRGSLVLNPERTSTILKHLDAKRHELKQIARERGWHRDPFKGVRA
jgi:hypothetical protein